MGWIPQIGRNCLPIPVRGGIKARTERYADRVRIICATAARGEAANPTNQTRTAAAERTTAGQKLSTEKTGTGNIIFIQGLEYISIVHYCLNNKLRFYY